MEEFNFETFKNKTQGFINRWYEDPELEWSNHTFSKLGKISETLEPWTNFLPEPYLGDFCKNSAVVLNYNPGGVIPEVQNKVNGKFIHENDAVGNYNKFAKSIYYFQQDSGFWYNWKKFLRGLSPSLENDLNPFAIEICPWHSPSFKLSENNIKDIRLYLEETVLLPAEAASMNSRLKIIFSIGKDYYNLFHYLNFKKTDELHQTKNEGNWPRKNNGQLVDRTISLWKSDNGIVYFNSFAPGGNKPPSKDFYEIIKEFINI